MTMMDSITSIVLGFFTLLSGCGWFISGRKHRQEVKALKADNRLKDMELGQRYVEQFEQNIAEPLRREVRELRDEVKELRNELETVKGCVCYRALTALIVSACSVSKQVSTKSDVKSQTTEVRDSSRVEQVMVAVCDSITETTTIIIRENEQGDTLRMSVVTDRDRSRSKYDVRSKKEEVRVVRDTVFVAVRDSVYVSQNAQKAQNNGPSALTSALKWVFWIIVGLSALIIIVKLKV